MQQQQTVPLTSVSGSGTPRIPKLPQSHFQQQNSSSSTPSSPKTSPPPSPTSVPTPPPNNSPPSSNTTQFRPSSPSRCNTAVIKFGAEPENSFILLDKLGEGSFGAVWKAHHRSGSVYAIKKVGIDDNMDDLGKEIEFMKALVCPYIVRYFGSFYVKQEVWIIMEYCAAGSLRSMMKNCKRTLQEEEIVVVAAHVLRGLQYLHSLRKLHRDLKASNILVDEKDFGVSGQLTDTQSRRHTMIGTPFWMSPEVIQDVGYDEHADIWSFGITLLELAEGQPPHFDVNPMRVIFMIPQWGPPSLADKTKWSLEFQVFLERTLKKNPEERPLSAELLEDPIFKKENQPDTVINLVREQEQALRKQALEELAAKNRPSPFTPLRSSSTTSTSAIDLNGLTGVMAKLALENNNEGTSDTVEEQIPTESDLSSFVDQSMPGTMTMDSPDDEERERTMVITPQRPAFKAGTMQRACTKCDAVAQELEAQKAENVRLVARVQALEERLDKSSKELLAATSEANLYKGQCLIFERLFMNKQSPT